MSRARFRIVCLGNRLVERDAAGPAVYDELARRPLPPTVEAIDGGVAGLDVLPHLDGAERVVLIDALFDADTAPGVYRIDPAGLEAPHAAYGHGAGLPYLLRALPLALDDPLPQVVVLGVVGGDRATITRAADAGLRLAVEGWPAALRPRAGVAP